MSCTDITAFVGETRNAEGGSVELIDIGTESNNAMITTTTPWGSEETFEVISLNKTLHYKNNGDSFDVTLTGIVYSESRNLDFAVFKVCYEVVVPGTLNCTSNPTGVKIYIGSTYYGVTNRNITLDSGTYTIKYILDRYESYSKTVTIVSGQTTYLSHNMVPIIVVTTCNQVFLFIDVNNDPITGATLSINNKTLTSSGGSANTALEVGKSYTAVATWGNWTLSRTFTACLAPMSFFFAPPFLDVGYIRCRAFDSVTNASLTAFLQIDGISIVPTTPHTTPMITTGPHTVTFIHEGYETKTVSVTVVKNETADAYGSMVLSAPPIVPGFDINVNIQGLLPGSSLFVFEVDKVPLTDTWWDSPFGSGMQWDNISNGTFKARESRVDCSPAPTTHQSLRPGQDYVIYVGTSAISLYPGTLVHRLTDSTTHINITDSYVDWVSTTLCAAFDISPEQCPNFIITSVNDAAFLLEQWKIITEHKNLAGEDVTPTALDYALIPIAVFGMFSPGLSEGKITQIVGQRLTRLIEISKKAPDDVKVVLNDSMVDTFLLRATDSTFDDFVHFLDDGLSINAHTLLKQIDDIPLSETELHALHRGTHLVEQLDNDLLRAGSIEKLSTVLSRFSSKLKNVYHNALWWARDNPKMAFTVGVLTIWFMIDNVPFYIYMYLKSKGLSPGDRSWQGKLTADIIDQYKFNVIEAEKIQDWDLFCENLLLWKEEVDSFEQFVADNESALRNEETYDIYIGTIEVYRKAIDIKQEVHTCWHEPLPEEFDAIVKEIFDGDTVKIEYADKEYDVRLLGINAPEGKTYDYTCTDLREPFLVRRLTVPGKECIDEETWHVDEAFFNSTKSWLGANLPVNQVASFRSDINNQFDKYNRLLAVPWVGNISIIQKSLAEGQSVVFFYSDNKQVNQEYLLEIENIAKEANIGVWPFAAEPPKTGWIKFTSTPTAVEIFLDDELLGNTVSNVLYHETTIGTHTYEFKKVGYTGCKGTILEINTTHTENAPFEQECVLEKIEIPPTTCPNPNASFAVSDATVEVGELITFNATASTPGEDQSISSYEWTFGDGTTATGMIVSHSFETAGLFVVRLDVKNNCGKSDPTPATKSITISEPAQIPAVWEIGNATDTNGNVLSAAQVFVDDIYIGHYAPETLKFCTGCTCDTVVPCGFGAHTVTVKKTGFADWSNTRTLVAGDSFTDNPVMEQIFEFEILSNPEGATIKVDGKTMTVSLNLIEQIMSDLFK